MQTYHIDMLDRLNDADLQEFLNLIGLRFRQARDAVNLSREEFVNHFHFRNLFGSYSRYKIKDIESGDFGKRNARGEAIKFISGMAGFFNVDPDIFWDSSIRETGFIKKIRKGMKNKYSSIFPVNEEKNNGKLNEKFIDRTETGDEGKIYTDWGDAPEIGKFHGRQTAIAALKKWIIEDRCRVVSVLGMGGIGKTRLTLKFCSSGNHQNNFFFEAADIVKNHFEFFIWRKLNDQPRPDHFFEDIILFISRQKESAMPDNCRGKISRLLWYMRMHRCLIVLDNMESVMTSRGPAGQFLNGFEDFGYFLQQAGEVLHQSCVLVTAREKPLEISMAEGPDRPVRSIVLGGLSEEHAKRLIMDVGLFSGTTGEFRELIRLYNGNPLALNLSARHIQDIFFGDIQAFLSSGISVFCDIRRMLDQHFERLTAGEKELLYSLAIHREAMTMNQLEKNSISCSFKNDLSSVMQWLRRRIAVEKTPGGFTLQPVLMAYVTERIIEECCGEIETRAIDLFNRLPLYEASANDQIRQAQRRFILQPILERLEDRLGQKETKDRFRTILDVARSGKMMNCKYCGGNLFNLIPDERWENDLFDFSHIAICEGEIKGKKLNRVRFYGNHFQKCEFYHVFGTITAAAVSPKGDLVAFGDKDGYVYLFDPTDRRILSKFQNPPGWIWSVLFSPDGETIISSCGDGSIRFWNTAGENTGVLKKSEGAIHDLSIHPGGRILASCESDGKIHFWDLPGKTLIGTIKHGMDNPVCLEFSPDGKILAIGCSDGKIQLWDWEKLQALHFIEAHDGLIWSLAWKHDGGMIASGGKDRIVRLWNPGNGECLGSLRGHDDFIRCLGFSPEGSVLASGSQDNTIRIWETANFSCIQTFHGHSGWVWTLSFGKRNPFIISTGHDKTIRIWDRKKGNSLKTVHGYDPVAPVVRFLGRGCKLVIGCSDGAIRVWGAEEYDENTQNKPQFSFEKELAYRHTHIIASVAVSPNNRKIATGSIDNTLKIYDLETDSCLSISQGRDGWVWSTAFSPDSKLVACISENYTVRLFDADEGIPIQTLAEHTNWVRTVTFDPTGRFLITGGADKTLRLWESGSGKCVQIFEGHERGILCAAISGNGKIVASGSGDGVLKIWDLASGKCLLDILDHSGKIYSLRFHPNGRLMFSGGSDNIVYIHDISNGTCLKTLKYHTDSILSIDISEDGRFLASGSKDETIRIWDLETLIPVQTIRFPKPYEKMNIFLSKGLTGAQKASLLALGACEIEEK